VFIKMDDRNLNEEELLKKLIRMSREKSVEEFVRPENDTITAYLMGSASDEQDEIVRKALIESSEFRSEILQLAQDIEKLNEKEEDVDKKNIEKIAVPEREEFLARFESPTIWKKIWQWRIPQFYAPALAAAAVIIFIVIPMLPKGNGWNLVYESVESGLLISNITRESASIESKKSYLQAEQAALAGCRCLLKYEDSEFQLNPIDSILISSESDSTILLRLTDKDDALLSEYEILISKIEAETIDSNTAWALGLPSKKLLKSSISIEKDTVSMIWPFDINTQGCITFTYKKDEGYRSLIGFTVDLRKH